MTTDLGIELQNELDRREKLIASLTEECDAIRKVLGIMKRPNPEPIVIDARTPSRRSGKRCKKCGKFAAEGATFYKHSAFADGLDNHCKNCRRVKQNSTRAEKKSAAAVREEIGPTPLKKPTSSVEQKISHRCPSCPETFTNLRDLGIHKSQKHFGSQSLLGSSLAP
jgi:hypothetical protein